MSQLKPRLELTSGVVKPVPPAAVDQQLRMTLPLLRIKLCNIDVFTGEQGGVVLPLIRWSQLMNNQQQLKLVQLES